MFKPKCQALTELVSDLSEQNFMLLKTVEELEKEALCRAEAFSNLAEAAKDTMQQDVSISNVSYEYRIRGTY